MSGISPLPPKQKATKSNLEPKILLNSLLMFSPTNLKMVDYESALKYMLLPLEKWPLQHFWSLVVYRAQDVSGLQHFFSNNDKCFYYYYNGSIEVSMLILDLTIKHPHFSWKDQFSFEVVLAYANFSILQHHCGSRFLVTNVSLAEMRKVPSSYFLIHI